MQNFPKSGGVHILSKLPLPKSCVGTSGFLLFALKRMKLSCAGPARRARFETPGVQIETSAACVPTRRIEALAHGGVSKSSLRNRYVGARPTHKPRVAKGLKTLAMAIVDGGNLPSVSLRVHGPKYRGFRAQIPLIL